MLNIRTPKTINFPFETNAKLMALGVTILTPLKGKSAIFIRKDLLSLDKMSQKIFTLI